MKIPTGCTAQTPLKIVSPEGLRKFLASKYNKPLFAEVSSDVLTKMSEKGEKSIEIGELKSLKILAGKLPQINLNFILSGGCLNAENTRVGGNVTAIKEGAGLFGSILGNAKAIGNSIISVEKGIKGSALASDKGVIKAKVTGSCVDASQGGVVRIEESINSSATATSEGTIFAKTVFGDATAGKDSLIYVKDVMHNANTYKGGKIEVDGNVLGHTHGENITVDKTKVHHLPWENFDSRERFKLLKSLEQR